MSALKHTPMTRMRNVMAVNCANHVEIHIGGKIYFTGNPLELEQVLTGRSRAVNAHAALVKALRELLAAHSNIVEMQPVEPGFTNPACDRARAALRAVE